MSNRVSFDLRTWATLIGMLGTLLVGAVAILSLMFAKPADVQAAEDRVETKIEAVRDSLHEHEADVAVQKQINKTVQRSLEDHAGKLEQINANVIRIGESLRVRRLRRDDQE